MNSLNLHKYNKNIRKYYNVVFIRLKRHRFSKWMLKAIHLLMLFWKIFVIFELLLLPDTLSFNISYSKFAKLVGNYNENQHTVVDLRLLQHLR